MRKIFFLAISFFLIIISVSFAETNGTINTSSYNNTAPVTGLFGYTVDFCNNDAECFGYKCFKDYDDSAGGSKAGWCNQTSITDCYHDGKNYTKGFYFCTTNTTYRRCDSGGNGTWSAATECSSGQTCTSGMSGPCAAASSTSSGGGGAGAGTTEKKASVEISAKFGDFEMIQDNATNRTVTVKNNGDLTLGNVYVEVSGVPFASVLTGSVTLNKTKSQNFTITFAPTNATEVKTYDGEVKVTTNYTNATASFKFKLKLLPSASTIEETIIPSYSQYSALLAEYEKNMTDLEKQGYNVSEAKSILVTIRAKLDEINQSLEKKDYFAAATQISEAKVLFDELGSATLRAEKPAGPDILFYVLVAIVALAVIGIGYLFWPKKPAARAVM